MSGSLPIECLLKDGNSETPFLCILMDISYFPFGPYMASKKYVEIL